MRYLGRGERDENLRGTARCFRAEGRALFPVRFDPPTVRFRFVHPLVRRIRGLTQTNCLAKETVEHTSRDSGMDVCGAYVDEDSTSGRKLYVRLGGRAVISLTISLSSFYELFHNTYHPSACPRYNRRFYFSPAANRVAKRRIDKP